MPDRRVPARRGLQRLRHPLAGVGAPGARRLGLAAEPWPDPPPPGRMVVAVQA
jgi:hypothetical protein